MADKLGLGREIHELKFGSTFTSNNRTSFHTLRYDFKPASVDRGKEATVDVGTSQQVTVTVPHLDGSGTSHTIFKGSHRPYQRECVLVYDRTTGDITLEKLTHNIQLKKTRQEMSRPSSGPAHSQIQTQAHAAPPTISVNDHRKPSPQHPPESPRHRQNHRKTIGGLIPRHSPLQASPSYPKSPQQVTSHSFSTSPIAAASLPMIGLEDPFEISSGFLNVNDSAVSPANSPTSPHCLQETATIEPLPVGEISDSSSDSESHSSSSDSDSDCTSKPPALPIMNGHVNGKASPSLSMPEHLLNEDLQLSESGTETD